MKIGLYGGTFSPPHVAHVRAAKLFVKEAGLDSLIVMPAGIPPHKSADKWGKADIRLEMTRLAFSDFARVWDYEIKKEGRSYTVETLRHLREKYPKDELYMLVGQDMFLSLETWREPQAIMKLCTIVAIRRKGIENVVMEEAAEKYKTLYGAKVILIEDEPFEMSSTEIRNKIAAGGDTREFLTPAVAEYIENNKLYKDEQ